MQSVREILDAGEWMDTTTIGSTFETQLNQRTGQTRYRPLLAPPEPGKPRLVGEWRYGTPRS